NVEGKMGFKCGIVGLPNVGKSTRFNALTETAAAQAANYPFCTIEPNVGEVAVPDPRLDKLAEIAKSGQIIPTRLTFVDIAGLVRGASKGEGLGNQFLATIREVDAVAHVVRCFEDSDITHVEGKIAPSACSDYCPPSRCFTSAMSRKAPPPTATIFPGSLPTTPKRKARSRWRSPPRSNQRSRRCRARSGRSFSTPLASRKPGSI